MLWTQNNKSNKKRTENSVRFFSGCRNETRISGLFNHPQEAAVHTNSLPMVMLFH